MKYLSLFSGIGGFEIGIKNAYENLHGRNTGSLNNNARDVPNTNGEDVQGPPSCIGYSEIDKYATQIYQSHFPDHKNYGDITKIDETTLPDFDLLVGGFPCQSFSIAGLRRGFNDTRGTLFFDIARILREKQPRLCLLENVKGLLSHDSGRTFKTIISTLDELGYDVQWQVLNSKNFGVPQNRERVFVIGHLRRTPRPKVFPIGESDKEFNDPDRKNSSISVPPITGQGGRNLRGGFISSTINSGGGGQGAKTGLYKIEGKIRRLTPKECERLQGFPDDWTRWGVTITSLAHPFLISDTQRYKCLGNGVTTNVVQAIIEKLL